MTREEIRECLTGPVASLKTPFLEDGSIDYPGMSNFVDFVIAAGSRSIIITGGDSLLMILTDQEIAEVTKAVTEQVAGRAMIVAADGQAWTSHSIQFAKYCCQLRVDILMAQPPNFGRSSTVRDIADHYINVSQHIPVMLITSIFEPFGEQFGLEVLQILREEAPGVVAIKCDFCSSFARRMTMQFTDHWAIIDGGQKQSHFDIMHYGCDGYFSTYIDFCPEITQRYWQAIKTKEFETATQIIRDYDIPYYDFVKSLPGDWDAGTHGAMELFGITKRWRRLPFHSLTDEEMEKLADFFKGLSLL